MARKKYVNEAKLGAFIIFVLAIFAYLSLKVGRFNVGEDIEVDAVFDDAAGLVPDGSVMLAGVRIGTIEHLAVEHDKARVTMALRSDAKVRADAQATIRMKSLLGEKYLEIIPRSKDTPLLQAGDTIKSTFVPTEFDQLVNRLSSIVDRLDATDPEHGNVIDNMSKLTASLSKIAAESGETIPPALKNLRDATAEIKQTIADNKKGVRDTLAEVHALAATANRILEKNEGHIDNIALNLDKSSAAFAENSGETAKSLNELLKNLAKVTERLPKVLDNLTELAGKFETTLDRTNKLLVKLDSLDEKTIRKLLQEDGITINLFRKKIDEDDDDQQQKKAHAKKGEEKKDTKERAWLIFPK